MATGVPARVVIVCAVLASANPLGIAQPQPSATLAEPAGAPAPVAARRQVAVIDLTDDDTAAEALATALYNALVNHVDLRPLVNPSFVQALKGPFADEERAFLETARRAKQEADDLLVNQLDYRGAEQAAQRGTTALLAVRPTPDVLGLYAELAFDAGQAALRQRKPNDASLAFGLADRLDPGKRPDPARYEPDIVEAYKFAVTKIPVAAHLEVKGSGSVWIDGVDRGPPGTFDVAQGLHLVQLLGPERETRGRIVHVPETTAVEIDPAPASTERKVERARVELARTRDAAARAGAVKKLAQLLGVGDAVLIETGPGGLRVQTWRDREPGFSAMVEHEDEPAVDLLAPLAPPRKPDPPKGTEPEIPLPPIVETPFYRKRWFYGSLALGVVAAAIVIYVAATSDRMIGFDGDIKPEGE